MHEHRSLPFGANSSLGDAHNNGPRCQRRMLSRNALGSGIVRSDDEKDHGNCGPGRAWLALLNPLWSLEHHFVLGYEQDLVPTCPTRSLPKRRARKEDGSPEYEASYEINASLNISVPEFQQLVSHEVVPGHVTTFAFLQNLYERKKIGFEGTVLTMNTPGATLFEGLANNAILIAYGVTEIDDLPDPDLQIGVLLALLQDDAKNQAAYLTWKEGLDQKEVAAALRRDYLVSEERAESLSGAWGRHPLLGRMCLPAYRAGTEKVAELRRKYPPEKVLPALYGCNGLVDISTVESAIRK